MSLTSLPMLDFTKLRTPPDHGEVLVAPEPAAWVQAARANGESLRDADVPLLDSTLAAWRRKTREAVVGRDDALVFVIGHQPAFIHPGVWAKHIAAMRVAAAVDGVALDLVVDSDAPKRTILPVPCVTRQGLALTSISFAHLPAGYTYEQIARQGPAEAARFERAVREAMGDRYRDSQMPTFFDAFSQASGAGDWVDQAVAARRAVEAGLGVVVDDRRVSSVWCSPLLIDILVNAERFAASYNDALRWYRRAHRVRGGQRPIPDLNCSDQRCEVPVWAYRRDGPRRRLFVARAGESLRLFADREEIGCVARSDDLGGVLADPAGWRLRPRALTLTIWARLLLADLFIHGIGGAKYDRISDTIIADYYGLTPPHMACVSATLHMGLPHGGATEESVRRLRHALRDMAWNPQRNLDGGNDLDPLIERRAEAVRRAIHLHDNDRRNRRARRAAFTDIRDVNATMLATRQEMLTARRDELARAAQDLQQSQIARGREYFFGLYGRARLEELMEALPAERDFRV